ncbi:hypothetical protein SAMN02799624_06173 [Paenibacillus sp. UNC496MF]|nr:hypothetical protein SAMN02799624_06173 [Paenibacillus sp. UNC496MF]
MSTLTPLKQSKWKYLLLLLSSGVTTIAFLCSYIAIFGFEYHHRFREGYIGPGTISKFIGVVILVGYLILTYVVTWDYNRDINSSVVRIFKSLFNAIVILSTGSLLIFLMFFFIP